MKYLDHSTGELIDFEWKTPYNHDTNAESDKGGLICPEPTLCQQHEAEQADINTIVKNFGVTGQIPQIPLPPPLEEFGEIFDFQSAMNTMAAAKHSFAMLPAETRAAFYNDPHNMVAIVDSMLKETDEKKREDNLSQLRLLGLALPAGPVADNTTLGDLLKALKERSTPPDPNPPKTP